MEERIIRDIRYYEVKPETYSGKFDGILGNIFHHTKDTKNIGQRIARKLNEVGFGSGHFDHIYIKLNGELGHRDIIVSDNYGDSRISSYEYGIDRQEFNTLTDEKKDSKILEITFEILKSIYSGEQEKLDQLESVQSLILLYGRDLPIHFKTKETKDFKIDVSYQIMP